MNVAVANVVLSTGFPSRYVTTCQPRFERQQCSHFVTFVHQKLLATGGAQGSWFSRWQQNSRANSDDMHGKTNHRLSCNTFLHTRTISYKFNIYYLWDPFWKKLPSLKKSRVNFLYVASLIIREWKLNSYNSKLSTFNKFNIYFLWNLCHFLKKVITMSFIYIYVLKLKFIWYIFIYQS